jgi:hypothetical protein
LKPSVKIAIETGRTSHEQNSEQQECRVLRDGSRHP